MPAKTKTKPAKSVKKANKASAADKQEMMRLLRERYPDADCELDYDQPWQLMVAVILSAQCTDPMVNKVTKVLFKHFPTAKALAEGSLDEIKEIIRPTGYYNAKGQNIHGCCQALVERYGGRVPDDVDELVKLPGVGRKTANVVVGVLYAQSAWTVDTHVQRLCKRLGFSNETDPYKIEIELQKLFPKDNWSQNSITLIWHGRRTCYARKPDCKNCPINHLCPSSEA